LFEKKEERDARRSTAYPEAVFRKTGRGIHVMGGGAANKKEEDWMSRKR